MEEVGDRTLRAPCKRAPASGGQIEPRAQALHPDGDRFIFAVAEASAAAGADGAAEPERVVLVQNFAAELARLLRDD